MRKKKYNKDVGKMILITGFLIVLIGVCFESLVAMAISGAIGSALMVCGGVTLQ